ncbi:MAG: phosphotransferase [Ilumatobacter sp.]
MPLVPRVVLDSGAGRPGAEVMALAGSSDWRRRVIDRIGAGAVRAGGASIWPIADPPAWPTSTWEELDAELTAAMPGLRLMGAVLPRQVGRRRLSVLATMRCTTVVVKLGAGGTELRNELQALTLLQRQPLPGIATPEPIASGSFEASGGRTDYLATTSIAIRRQRAALDEPLRTFEHDLADRLGELAKAGSTPPGAVPIHGDLTPWNLRRTPRGLALFDWEAAGWGPPGSDLATYRRACDDVRRPWSSSPRNAHSS